MVDLPVTEDELEAYNSYRKSLLAGEPKLDIPKEAMLNILERLNSPFEGLESNLGEQENALLSKIRRFSSIIEQSLDGNFNSADLEQLRALDTELRGAAQQNIESQNKLASEMLQNSNWRFKSDENPDKQAPQADPREASLKAESGSYIERELAKAAALEPAIQASGELADSRLREWETKKNVDAETPRSQPTSVDGFLAEARRLEGHIVGINHVLVPMREQTTLMDESLNLTMPFKKEEVSAKAAAIGAKEDKQVELLNEQRGLLGEQLSVLSEATQLLKKEVAVSVERADAMATGLETASHKIADVLDKNGLGGSRSPEAIREREIESKEERAPIVEALAKENDSLPKEKRLSAEAIDTVALATQVKDNFKGLGDLMEDFKVRNGMKTIVAANSGDVVGVKSQGGDDRTDGGLAANKTSQGVAINRK